MYSPPPSLDFLPLLKTSLDNSYLKIIDLSKLVAGEAPLKKKNWKVNFMPSQRTLKYGYKIAHRLEGSLNLKK